LTGFYCELVAYWRVEQIGIVMGRIFEQKWRLACSGGSLTDYVKTSSQKRLRGKFIMPLIFFPFLFFSFTMNLCIIGY
jgi:hypothetical protein